MVCKKALSTSFYFVIKFLCPQFLAIIENDTYGLKGISITPVGESLFVSVWRARRILYLEN